MIDQRLHETHYNPVEEGFVSNPEDYLYRSTRDYTGEPGLVGAPVITRPLREMGKNLANAVQKHNGICTRIGAVNRDNRKATPVILEPNRYRY